MIFSYLIAASFAIGFFFESIFGFGGGLIAYSILSFFIDLKTAIIAGLYIGTLSSIHIILSDYRSFNKKIFLKSLPIAVIGSLLGTIIFNKFPVKILELIFGILLILLSLKNTLFDNYKFPKIFKNKLLVIGAISQGAFGVGGPFVVNALKDDFKNKSELRTTMAFYFVFCNFIRLSQFLFSKNFKDNFPTEIIWTVIPVFFAIWLGHKVHLKINESVFRKGIGIITFFAGVKFLSKFF